MCVFTSSFAPLVSVDGNCGPFQEKQTVQSGARKCKPSFLVGENFQEFLFLGTFASDIGVYETEKSARSCSDFQRTKTWDSFVLLLSPWLAGSDDSSRPGQQERKLESSPGGTKVTRLASNKA